jgi:hypothetical protein
MVGERRRPPTDTSTCPGPAGMHLEDGPLSRPLGCDPLTAAVTGLTGRRAS